MKPHQAQSVYWLVCPRLNNPYKYAGFICSPYWGQVGIPKFPHSRLLLLFFGCLDLRNHTTSAKASPGGHNVGDRGESHMWFPLHSNKLSQSTKPEPRQMWNLTWWGLQSRGEEGQNQKETKTWDNYRLWQMPQRKPARCQNGHNGTLRVSFRPRGKGRWIWGGHGWRWGEEEHLGSFSICRCISVSCTSLRRTSWVNVHEREPAANL